MKRHFNPTLFDKLVSDLEMGGLREGDATTTPSATESAREGLRFYTVPRVERFNEEALRATVRRELVWLLNTIHLESVIDLTRHPHVRTSVLNYGVADLTGKASSQSAIDARTDNIRDAILAFEPRLSPRDLEIEPQIARDRDNAITFMIRGDVTSALQAVPMEFTTDVEIDTGAATVRT